MGGPVLLRSSLLLVLLALLCHEVLPLVCHIGMGQRGKLYQNGIGWTRTCPPLSKYCFEVVTKNVKQAKKLFNYPWDSYYDYFYVRSCGGDFGTNNTWHPYKLLPKLTRHVLGMVKINITTPLLISGEGCPYPPNYSSGDFVPHCINTVQMDLRYKCKKDLCEKYNAGSAGSRASLLTLITALIVSTLATAAMALI